MSTSGGHAFLWQNGIMTDLGTIGGTASEAQAINESGQIAGLSTLLPAPNTTYHAVLWENGSKTDLTPSGPASMATGINDARQVVGNFSNSQAFFWENNVLNWGHVVGAMRAAGGFSNFHAYIFADGVARNLNSLIPAGSGLHLVTASAINNAGQIVGLAFDSRGGYHAFLLNPVAPGTPVVNIADASVAEGHVGTRSATFTVTLSNSSSLPVTVSYGTVQDDHGPGCRG
jgi:probable HAF family extracellular repeat protein